MTIKALWKSLERLHEVGFIDRLHAGSASRKGDYATYQISERWRRYGEKHFERVPWPKGKSIGIRSVDGTFLPRNTRKKHPKRFLVAEGATTESSLMASNATTDPPLVAAGAINRPPNEQKLVAADAIYLDNHVSRDFTGVSNKGEEKEGKTNCARSYQPPRSEIRDNVIEILRQRSDPRADGKRFVAFLTDQLHGVQHGRLDVGRVHRDLIERSGLDDFTADMILTTSGVDYVPAYARTVQ